MHVEQVPVSHARRCSAWARDGASGRDLKGALALETHRFVRVVGVR